MSLHWDMIEVTATYSNVLQCIAVRCNILQYTATHTEGGITLPWDMIIGHCVTYNHVPFVCVYMNVCHVHTHHSTNISWSMNYRSRSSKSIGIWMSYGMSHISYGLSTRYVISHVTLCVCIVCVDRGTDIIWDVTYIVWAQYSVCDIPCDIVCVYCVCR